MCEIYFHPWHSGAAVWNKVKWLHRRAYFMLQKFSLSSKTVLAAFLFWVFQRQEERAACSNMVEPNQVICTAVIYWALLCLRAFITANVEPWRICSAQVNSLFQMSPGFWEIAVSGIGIEVSQWVSFEGWECNCEFPVSLWQDCWGSINCLKNAFSLISK